MTRETRALLNAAYYVGITWSLAHFGPGPTWVIQVSQILCGVAGICAARAIKRWWRTNPEDRS